MFKKLLEFLAFDVVVDTQIVLLRTEMVHVGNYDIPAISLKDCYSASELHMHGAQWETRTPKTTLLRRIRLPIASIGHGSRR